MSSSNLNNDKSWNKNENECPHSIISWSNTSNERGKRTCLLLSPDENDAKPEHTKVNEKVPNLDISEINKNNFQISAADILPEIMKTVKSEMESIKTELKNELKTN